MQYSLKYILSELKKLHKRLDVVVVDDYVVLGDADFPTWSSDV